MVKFVEKQITINQTISDMLHNLSKVLLSAVLAVGMTAGAYAADVDINVASYNLRQKNHQDSVQGDGLSLIHI